MTKRYARIKVYPNGPFLKEIKGIITERRATVDRMCNRELSFARICDQMVREPEFQFIKQKLLRFPRKEDLR